MATRDDLYTLIFDEVTAAMALTDVAARTTQLRDAAAAAFAMAYEDAGGEPAAYEQAEMAFENTLNSAAAHTHPDGTPEQVERVATLLATAAANGAIVAAAEPGTELTWVTRLDDAVRDIHRPLHGEVRAAGTPFLVAGEPLLYPGQPVGPPEGWINCRCVLHAAVTGGIESSNDSVTAADDGALVAREFDTAKRKAMAKRNTAMPDGSFPIANAEDLRNAIQAIGRAKEPDKVKAHIRRRAKALGLTELLPNSWTASADLLAPDIGQPLYRQEFQADGDEGHREDSGVSGPYHSYNAAGPVNTHDAPGWLTNPKETQRLRTYWSKGEGAAKIRWGQPGDFDRCRKQLAKYVKNPSYLAGTCANLHYVALGYWPNAGPHAGKHGKSGLPGSGECTECETFDPDNTSPQGAAVTAAFAAVADLAEELPPREWFTDPGFEGPTALTATDDGEVMGHIGQWDQCHTGYGDTCVPPPHSTRDYHHFRTGYVQTAGGNVAVGNLTLGTGHAPDGIGAAAAVAHYDNTGTAVADVAAGEDAYGIWVHGMLRPGVGREAVHALRAGTVSGDWRTLGGQYELVAALVVNVPGFPIPRPAETLAAGGQPLSLVAAGIVGIDPNAFDADRIAIAVIDRLDARQRREANVARVAAMRTAVNGPRVQELIAAIGAN